MGFKFLAAFSKEKMEQAGDAFTRAIVEFDPETASDAQIELMDQQVSELSKEFAKAKQSLAKESQEAEAAKANFNKKLEAANRLQDKIAEATGKTAKSLQDSLNSLMEDMENTRPDVELEIQEAADAQALVDAIEANLNMAAQKLKTARSDLKRAQGEMKRAEMAEERAKREEELAKQQAGISSGGNSMNVALDAMKAAAADRNANAEASRTKANLLKPFDSAEDDNIAAVMAEIDGTDTPTDSASKLAGMKGF